MICSTSLEPEEDYVDQSIFNQLVDYVDGCVEESERDAFFRIQLPTIVDCALRLKAVKPPRGFHFSLQQQSQ